MFSLHSQLNSCRSLCTHWDGDCSRIAAIKTIPAPQKTLFVRCRTGRWAAWALNSMAVERRLGSLVPQSSEELRSEKEVCHTAGQPIFPNCCSRYRLMKTPGNIPFPYTLNCFFTFSCLYDGNYATNKQSCSTNIHCFTSKGEGRASNSFPLKFVGGVQLLNRSD